MDNELEFAMYNNNSLTITGGDLTDWQKEKDLDDAKATCPHCGKSHGNKTCWAKDRECSSCGEKGHFKVVCPKNTKPENPKVFAKSVRVGRAKGGKEDGDVWE